MPSEQSGGDLAVMEELLRERVKGENAVRVPPVMYWPEHTVLPKSTGVNFAVQHIRISPEKLEVWDMTLGFVPPGGKPAQSAAGIFYPSQLYTFFNTVVHNEAVLPEIHIHVRRFPIKDVPEDRAAFEKWLMILFEEKERLLAYFYANSHFPSDKEALQRVLQPATLNSARNAQRPFHLENRLEDGCFVPTGVHAAPMPMPAVSLPSRGSAGAWQNVRVDVLPKREHIFTHIGLVLVLAAMSIAIALNGQSMYASILETIKLGGVTWSIYERDLYMRLVALYRGGEHHVLKLLA